MKTLKTAFLSTLAALCSGGLFAATTWSGSVSLTSDLNETDELIVESGAAVDLNGHSVTLNGKLTVQGAATVTNSDTGDVKDAKFYCSNDLEDQFQNLTFSGNLKLTVGGKCKTNAGFQNATNTHTGGTVLDGYNTSASSQAARFNGNANFGPGDLTLKGGSRIYNTANVGTVPWPNLYIEGDSSVTNRVVSDQVISITGAVHAASGSILKAENNKNNAQSWSGSMSDMKGTMILEASQGFIAFYGSGTFEYGTIELVKGNVRFPSDSHNGEITIGTLRSPEGTSTTSGSILNTTDWSTLTLKVGELNTDSVFYGNIGNDYSKTKGRKDIKLEKVGSGTLTLGGENEYMNDTTISAGAIKLVGSGRLGYTSNTSPVYFNGGEFIYGDANVSDPSSRFATNGTTTATAKIGVENGVIYTMAGNLSKCDDFEKTRDGTLVLSSSLLHKGDTTVSAGTLVVPVGGSLGTGALSIASGAKVLIDASSASWDDGDTVSLFTVGLLDAGTTLSIDNIGLYGVSGKTAIDSITLDGTTVKATVSTKTLLWNGGNGTWDTTSANWVNKADTTESLVYAEGDKVEFGGDTAYTVTISSDVTPSQLTLAPKEGGNVTFAGDGAINLAAFVKGGAGTVTLGNGKNPFTTLTVNAGTLALGADQPLATETATLHLAVGARLDLNGHNMFIGTSTRPDGAGDSYAVVTNSVDGTLATFTAGCGNTDAKANYYYCYGGNLRYVTTGNNSQQFWGTDNYHTGGTVFSNVSHRVRSPYQAGTGRIIVAEGGKWDWASSNPAPYNHGGTANDYKVVTNDFEAVGSGNSISFGAYSGNGEYIVSSGLYGDSDSVLTISAGWQHSVKLTGDVSSFAGTLTNAISNTTADKGLYFQNQAAAGLQNANVVQPTPSGSNTNKIFVAGEKSFGALLTDTATPVDAYVYARDVASTLKVGGKAGGTYSGSFRDYSSAALSVEKIGADTTWTLTGTNHNFSGTFAVTAGKVVFNNSEAVALGSGITVGANGTIGGSGTITSPIAFTSGARVEVAAGGSSLTFASVVDVSALTVKLTGELDTDSEYTILTAGSGSYGKATLEVDARPAKGVWRTKWVTSGGTKILKGYYVKSGLVIIFR